MTLHPSHHARTMPDKPAYRMVGSGSAITYGELDRVSDQGAQQLRALGLKPQDHIALLAENSLHFFEICWAAIIVVAHSPVARVPTPVISISIVSRCLTFSGAPSVTIHTTSPR